MSKKPLIELLLERFSKGEQEVLPKLCAQLADRLLIVPSLAVEADGETTKVSVLQIKIEDLPAIACFTSEKRFNDWKNLFEFKYDKLDLLGADLSIVMGPGKGLLIDPASEHETILSAEDARMLAQEAEQNVEKPLPRPTLLEIPPVEPQDFADEDKEILLNQDAILAGDQELANDSPSSRKSHSSRVLEQPEYDSQTLVHTGPIDIISASVVMEKLAPFTPEPFEPLPPEASELPPEVARRVAKLVAQNGRKQSGSVYRPEERNPLNSSSTQLVEGRSKKRRGLFGFLKGKDRR